jgi:hypothetical protein
LGLSDVYSAVGLSICELRHTGQSKYYGVYMAQSKRPVAEFGSPIKVGNESRSGCDVSLCFGISGSNAPGQVTSGLTCDGVRNRECAYICMIFRLAWRVMAAYLILDKKPNKLPMVLNDRFFSYFVIGFVTCGWEEFTAKAGQKKGISAPCDLRHMSRPRYLVAPRPWWKRKK